MEPSSEVNYWLSLLPKNKRNNLKVVHRDEVDRQYLYHLTMDARLRTMAPQVSQRTLSAEDRAIPRISTSTSLAGCMLGYQSTTHDFQQQHYRGWYIYGLEYDYAVIPNKRLLPDVDVSEEFWLVTYDGSTTAYKTKMLAKFFIETMRVTRRLRKTVNSYIGYVDVLTDAGFYLTKTRKIPKGKYRVTWEGENLYHERDDTFLVEAISASEFDSVNRVTVSLLSMDEPLPGSAGW